MIKNKEACVGDFYSALQAQQNGATRVELCDNLFEGGTTPSLGVIKACVEELHIPVQVMIRPRGGDFYYSDLEKEIMLYDLKHISALKPNGVVVGSLTQDNQLDEPFLKEFIYQSKGLQTTFHKAIDEMSNPVQAVKILENLGFSHILTSGTKDTAENGTKILKEMIQATTTIKIIVAGGVTSHNIQSLHATIQAEEYHGKKIVSRHL